jgi:hypothetical protein
MLSFRRKHISENCRLLLILIVMLVGMSEVKAQRTYATTQRSGITSNVVLGATVATGTVTNPSYSTDADLTNSTSLSTTSTLGIGTAWIQLIFPTGIAANTTSFVKINNSAGALLGGEVSVKAYTGSTTSLDGTSVGITAPISTITSPDGSTFLVVTPNAGYNSIRVTLSSPVALGSNSASVYYAFNESPGTDCNLALATSTSVSGIAVGGSVTAPNNAIDNNITSYSTLSVGLLGVAASIKQMVYFSSLSNSGDAATVTFAVPPGLLTLGLFDGITLTAYNGPTQVGTPIAFSSLLSLNLLYLGAGNRYTGSFVPSGVFDRIEISTSSLASVLGSVYLYEIQRTPQKPTFSSTALQNPTICSGNSITLTPIAPASGNELRWYSTLTSNTPLHTGNTYTPSPALTTTTTYYVATAKTGCTAESERVPVVVTVNPLPPTPAGSAATICSGSNGIFVVTSPNAAYTYNWYTASTGGSPILTGTSVTTASSLSTNTTYYLEAVITATGCPSATRTAVTITVNTLPTAPAGTAAAICSGSNGVFMVTSPNATYTYNWYIASTGGSPILTGTSVTTAASLSNNTTYYLEAVITATGCHSTTRTAVTITVNPLPTAPAGTAAAICSGSNGVFLVTSPNVAYTYNWYTASTGGSPILTGTSVTTASTLSANTTYYLEAVTTATGCPSATRTAVTVTVNPLPTATISGSLSLCQNLTSPNITFTGANGTAPYTFTYNINGGTNTTITTTTGNAVTLPVPTVAVGTFSYNLISVKESSATQCVNNQTGTATVTIHPIPIVPPITIH